MNAATARDPNPSVETQRSYARRFRDLHVPGQPLLLINIWDPGSAKIVAEAGAEALATSSWSVAAAHGYADGEQLPFELALANVRAIAAAVELPVSVDLEAGYGPLGAVAASVSGVVTAGAIGFNLEDQDIKRGVLYPTADQAKRIGTARKAADARFVGAFINARTDVFLDAEPAKHDERLLDEALRRADAYANAGADGFFAPGLRDQSLIEKLCRLCRLPVNIMLVPDLAPPDRLSELGVARISYGPQPYRVAMAALAQTARQTYVSKR